MRLAEASSFEMFVSNATPQLLRLAWLLTQDRHDAEDLVQDALLRSHQRWSAVSEADDRRAYVRKILVNEFLQRARRKHPPTRPLERSDDLSFTDPSHGAVEDRAALQVALASLAPKQRTALVLRYFLDLDDEHTAVLMGCRRTTVRSHVKRGLAELRQVREGMGDPT